MVAAEDRKSLATLRRTTRRIVCASGQWRCQPREGYHRSMNIAETLPNTMAVLQDGIDRGYHFGGQVSVYRGGELIVDDAFGTLGPDSSEPMSRDHILCWRSAGKPWTAVAVMQCIERGELSLETPAYEGFAANALTTIVPPSGPMAQLKHVLTHTTGWNHVDIGWPNASHLESLERIRAVTFRDGAAPGEVAAYDPQGGWFVLGTLLERTADANFDDESDELPPSIIGILHKNVFTRAEVDAFIALSDENASVTKAPIAPQFNTQRGANVELPMASDAALRSPSPGSSCRGPVRSLAKLYAVLLSDLAGDGEPTLLNRSSVNEMTRRHREDMMDLTFQHKLDFGLGLIINSNRYGAETVPYGFGRYASERAFGHGGAQCAMGFADPEYDLAVGWVLNGLAGEPRHNKRNREINSAIYEDLGLA